MKDMDADIKIERLEDYYGEKEDIARKIDECTSCQSKLILSHLPDYKNLIIQETARCVECGKVTRKIISSVH